MEVQIFGVKKSADTRKAQRFFAERRIRVHFVDLTERAASPGELRRFQQKFGVTALIDKSSKRYAELGLGSSRMGDERWMQQLVDWSQAPWAGTPIWVLLNPSFFLLPPSAFRPFPIPLTPA